MKTKFSLTFIILFLTNFMFAQVGDSLNANRGVAMIWYGSQDNLDSRDEIVTVGQIYFMWRSFESTKNNYDFESLDRQLEAVHHKGMKTTIQINGNKHPDYIFQIVPYLDGVDLPTQRNHTPEIGYGPPMYWHPTYKERYEKLIDTLAQHIKKSPFKDTVLGIRQNYNAVGTEHHYIPPEYRNKSAWTFESGVTEDGKFPWNNEIADTYKRWTIDMYVEAFNPPEDIPVFIRASSIGSDVASPEQIEMVENGDLWIFHTSSEPQPRKGKIDQYQVFVDYAKTGKTYAFMESWGPARPEPGDDSWTRTEKPITKEQCNYWTLLVDLHCGATWPAMRPEDIDDPVFKEQFEFAAKYAGYAGAPKKSPGAWIAFREGDNMLGDYTFFMKRAAGDNSRPLYNVDDAPEGLWARQIAAGESMELVPDTKFLNSLHNNNGVKLSVTYKDTGTDDFEVELFGKTFKHKRTGTDHWLTCTKEVTVDELTNIRISAISTSLALHKVEVERGIINSIGNTITPKNVTIYPVPVKDEITIRLDGMIDNCTIKIYNILGTVVCAEQFNPVGKNMLKLGHNLPEGTYIVQVEADKNITMMRKIIKN